MAQRDPVTAAWTRIEKWLAENAEETLEALAGGASAMAIAKFQRTTGVKLLAAVRASYLRHDGDHGSGAFPAIETQEMAYSPMPLPQVASEWRSSSKFARSYPADAEFDADRGIRREYWNPGWIPIATNGGGDHHCIDLNPGPGGTLGQVIEWRHETDERRLLAPSWEQRLTELADGLEAGKYAFDDGHGIVRLRARRNWVAKSSRAAQTRAAAGGARKTSRPRKLSADDRALLRAAREVAS